MKKIVFLAIAAIALNACSSKTTALPRAERTDINTANFDSMFVWVDSRPTEELHSVMVVKDDAVIYERYAIGHCADELHVCWSASKTFTAIGVGFAVQDGLLSVNDPVVKFFRDDELPSERSEWLNEMTVKDLLIMSSGFVHDWIVRDGCLIENLEARVQLTDSIDFKPGSIFRYNSMNTYLCADIVQRVTGMKLVDYLKLKLFDPIGIAPETYVWDENKAGVNFGGWGLHMTAESLAKAGLFILHRGVWNGERLLQDSWFDEAMKVHIVQGDGVIDTSLNWKCGYGYQMWACRRQGAFRFAGAYGQICIVAPEKNAVIVLFSHAQDPDLLLDDCWKYVYDEL